MIPLPQQLYCNGNEESDISISGGTFRNNRAYGMGGAIAAWGTPALVRITGGTFENNHARYFFNLPRDKPSRSHDGCGYCAGCLGRNRRTAGSMCDDLISPLFTESSHGVSKTGYVINVPLKGKQDQIVWCTAVRTKPVPLVACKPISNKKLPTGM